MNSLTNLNADIGKLEKEIKDFKDVASKDVPKLWCFTKRGKKVLVKAIMSNGKLHRKQLKLNDQRTDEVLLSIIRKRCYERKVHNLEALKRVHQELVQDDIAEAVDWMVKKYEPITREYLINMLVNSKIDVGDVTSRAEKHKEDKFNNKKHIAITGQVVKSKSEAIIIGELEKYGIMYQYEHNFKIDGFEISPDFFIVRRDGEFIIWEHLGNMEDSRYLQRQRYKFRDYLKAGFAPWKNMIVTFDGHDGTIDVREVAFRIQQMLL